MLLQFVCQTDGAVDGVEGLLYGVERAFECPV